MTPQPPYQTLHDLIERQAENAPDHLAILFAKTSLRYGELNKKANQLAHFLIKQGLKPDSLIGLCMDRSADMLIAMLGILKAGAAYVPLDPSHPKERLQATLKEIEAAFLITQSSLKGKFPRFTGEIIALDEAAKKINTQSIRNPHTPLRPDNLAYVIYTSGSSGKPKGVLIEHQSVVNYSQWVGSYLHCRYPQRIDFSSNIIFDMAVTTSIVSLALGLTVVICKDTVKQDPHEYLQYLNDHKINFIKTTPSYFKNLLYAAVEHPTPLKDLQAIILGGENLSAADCTQWFSIYPKQTVINEYGPTEATVAASHYTLTQEKMTAFSKQVPIGKPGTNMQCHVLDSNQQPVDSGTIGELYIGGKGVARGYLKQPELTQKQFIQDPFSKDNNARLYRTGDSCSYLPDGNLQYFGRLDDQVKIRGYRIEPGEIEARLKEHKSLRDAIVVSLSDEAEHNTCLAAYYILKAGEPKPNEKQLRRFLKQHLPSYMIPSYFISLSAFPVTANGKLDKKALPSPLTDKSHQYMPPRTDLENLITNIWSQELDQTKIGIMDNFFEIGGHSLSAARIVSKLRKQLNQEIVLADLYQTPTIFQLARALNNKKSKYQNRATTSKLEPQDKKLLPLSDFQFVYWAASLAEPNVEKSNLTSRNRLAGRIDPNILKLAFDSLFKKHEILFYRAAKYFPLQYLQEKFNFKIDQVQLDHLSAQDSEEVLTQSLNELIEHKHWQKNAPLIVVRLFHLRDQTSELQICISHLLADDASLEILFQDLSDLYQLHQHKLDVIIDQEMQFKDYIQQEWHAITADLDRDIHFWESYLDDTDLFPFPEEHVVKDMASQNLAYSTYLELSDSWLSKLEKTASENKVSLTDTLCALLGVGLADYNTPEKKVFVHIIKSTRSDHDYDELIGCFLRLDAIKMDLSGKPPLIELAKQIQKSTIDTLPYQSSPGIIKMACLKYYDKKANRALSSFISILTKLCAKMFFKPKINYKVLMVYCRLVLKKRSPGFVINLNLLNSFVQNEQTEELFGFQLKNPALHQYDRSTVANLLEICFLKDNHHRKNYLVVSGNLQPQVRQKLGQNIIEALQ